MSRDMKMQWCRFQKQWPQKEKVSLIIIIMEICKAPTPHLKMNDDPSAAWCFNPGFAVCGVRVRGSVTGKEIPTQ